MKKLFSILVAICLIAGLLPVFASADSILAKVSVVSDADSGAKTTYELAEGDTVYLVTPDGAAHQETATASNYNIKIDYPSGGQPTIYLNGANLSTDKEPLSMVGSAVTAATYTIVVEKDSTIEAAAGNAISCQNAHLTVTGEGKLTVKVVKGAGLSISDSLLDANNPVCRYDLTLEQANLDLSVDLSAGGFGYGIGNHVRSVVVNGGNLVINNDTACGFYVYKGEILITGGAKMDMTVNDQSVFARNVKADFVMESGHMKVRCTSAMFGFNNDSTITFKGGTVDHSGGPFIYGPKPDFSEYLEEHTITVCNSKDGKGAKVYEPDVDKLNYMSYFQLTSGASYEVTVKNGTADKTVANKGDTITLTARLAPEGKAFDKWEVNEGDITLADPTASSTTFTMPGKNVRVTATYKDAEEDTGNDTGNNDEGNNNAGNDTNNNTGNDTNTNTGNNTNTDANKNEGNQNAEKKTNTTNVLLIVIIAILVLAIAGGVVFVVIRIKKLNADDAEESEEAPAEDAE